MRRPVAPAGCGGALHLSQLPTHAQSSMGGDECAISRSRKRSSCRSSAPASDPAAIAPLPAAAQSEHRFALTQRGGATEGFARHIMGSHSGGLTREEACSLSSARARAKRLSAAAALAGHCQASSRWGSYRRGGALGSLRPLERRGKHGGSRLGPSHAAGLAAPFDDTLAIVSKMQGAAGRLPSRLKSVKTPAGRALRRQASEPIGALAAKSPLVELGARLKSAGSVHTARADMCCTDAPALLSCFPRLSPLSTGPIGPKALSERKSRLLLVDGAAPLESALGTLSQIAQASHDAQSGPPSSRLSAALDCEWAPPPLAEGGRGLIGALQLSTREAAAVVGLARPLRLPTTRELANARPLGSLRAPLERPGLQLAGIAARSGCTRLRHDFGASVKRPLGIRQRLKSCSLWPDARVGALGAMCRRLLGCSSLNEAQGPRRRSHEQLAERG